MWPRTVEVMLGFWLAASPFIFHHPAEAAQLWWNDLGCALVIIILSLLSFWSHARRAHLATIAVALWLFVSGFIAFTHPVPPAAQNDIVIGLILLMLAIIPSMATLPPKGWREYHSVSSARKLRDGSPDR